MPRNKDPQKAEISLIMLQMKQIQGFREEIWKIENKRRELPKKVLKAREMTDRCMKRVKISKGKVYPRRIPKTLYNFGDTYDTVVERASEIVKLLDSDKSHSESEETSSDESNVKTAVAGPSPIPDVNDPELRENESVQSAANPPCSTSVVGKSCFSSAGPSCSSSAKDESGFSSAGPSCSFSTIDQDIHVVAGPSCSTAVDLCVPSVSGQSASRKTTHSKPIDTSHSSEEDSADQLKPFKSAPWYSKKGKLPKNVNGKDKTNDSNDLSSSSESEHSDNEEVDFDIQLESLNINTWPYLEKKKKKSRDGWGDDEDSDDDESVNLLPSDESDFSSEYDFESTDEDSPRYQHKLIKYRMRDMLKSGYERIRNEMGKTVYHSIRPERRDNDFIVYPDEDPVSPEEKPIFDDEGRAIINLENACDFQRFVVLDFPNIPSNDEDTIENDERFKKWAAELDRKCAVAEKNKSRINKGSQKTDCAQPSTSNWKPGLITNYKYSKGAKSTVIQKPKQITGKKGLFIPSDDDDDEAGEDNKPIEVSEDCDSWLRDMVKECNEFFHAGSSRKNTDPADQYAAGELPLISDDCKPRKSSVKQKQRQTKEKISDKSSSATNLKPQRGKKSVISSPKSSTANLKRQRGKKSEELSPKSSKSTANLKSQIAKKSEESSPGPSTSNQKHQLAKQSVKSSSKPLTAFMKCPIAKNCVTLPPKWMTSTTSLKCHLMEKSAKSSPNPSTVNQVKLHLTEESIKSAAEPSLSAVNETPKTAKKSKSTKLAVSSVEKYSKSSKRSPSLVTRQKFKKWTKNAGLKSRKLTSATKPKQQIKGKDLLSSEESVSAIAEEKLEKPKSAKLRMPSGKKQKPDLPKKSSFVTEENLQPSKKAHSKSRNVNASYLMKEKCLSTTRKQTRSSKRSVSSGIKTKAGSKSDLRLSTVQQGKIIKQNREKSKRGNDSALSVNKSKVLPTKGKRSLTASCKSKSVKKKRVSNSDNDNSSCSLVVRNLRSNRNKK